MGACWCQDGSRDALSRGDVLCDGVTGWTGGQTRTQTSRAAICGWMLRREFSLGCGRIHFCQSSASKDYKYKYVVNQVMLIR